MKNYFEVIIGRIFWDDGISVFLPSSDKNCNETSNGTPTRRGDSNKRIEKLETEKLDEN